MATLITTLSLVHHSTICLVPPPHSVCWETISELRRALRDKGFYRWPPHINLIYPFIDPSQCSSILPSMADSLKDIEPFEIILNEFSMFGSDSRGILYLNPTTACDTTDTNTITSIHTALTNSLYSSQTTPTKIHTPHTIKPFIPHMTVSHFPNLQSAAVAAEQFRPWTPLRFLVDKVYVLERRGDRGRSGDGSGSSNDQFCISYTLPLGQSGGGCEGIVCENGARFPNMPLEPEEWVHTAQEQYKTSSVRRARGSRQTTTDTPEEIEAKRLQRKLLREDKERVQGSGIGSDRR
eukprot:gene12938-27301_t